MMMFSFSSLSSIYWPCKVQLKKRMTAFVSDMTFHDCWERGMIVLCSHKVPAAQKWSSWCREDNNEWWTSQNIDMHSGNNLVSSNPYLSVKPACASTSQTGSGNLVSSNPYLSSCQRCLNQPQLLLQPTLVYHGNRWVDHESPVRGRLAYWIFHYLLNERDSKSRYDVMSKITA